MAAPSSLSVAARALRTHLSSAVGLPENQILIGHPHQAAKDIEGEANKQFLNLFFYRIDSGAAPVDGTAADPFFLRLYCLITALGTTETIGGSTVSAGENDLRLVGGVMKRLHESPFLMLQGESAQDVAQLQIVPNLLTLDDINRIWLTQGHTPYRLSMGYEMALVPVPLAAFVERAPRVGSIGIDVRAGTDFRPLPAGGFGTEALSSQVPAVFVDASHSDWTAHLCWLAADESLQYALVFSETSLPASLQVIALGEPGAVVQLEWEIVNHAEPNAHWTALAATPSSISLAADTLNPHQSSPPPASLAQNVAVPLQARGQATLYAVRNFVRPDGSAVKLRSNPLLVSVHGEDAS